MLIHLYLLQYTGHMWRCLYMAISCGPLLIYATSCSLGDHQHVTNKPLSNSGFLIGHLKYYPSDLGCI